MTKEELEEIYKVRGSLSFKKIMTYLPFMIMTNLSNLLLISVDGLVVGNFVGTKALASINIFSPIVIIIGVLSNFIAAAISTYLSVCMGKNDIDKIKRVKHCSKILMVVSTVFIAIAQLPIVYALINSYGVSDNMVKLTWQYAIGIMISMPFGMISTIGVCQLQIVGKMKALMVFSIVEGGVNLILDLLFVGAMNMGIAGAGYGTALANILRATMTLVYLYKKTDIFNTGKVKSNLEDMKNIDNDYPCPIKNVSIHFIYIDKVYKLTPDAFSSDYMTRYYFEDAHEIIEQDLQDAGCIYTHYWGDLD